MDPSVLRRLRRLELAVATLLVPQVSKLTSSDLDKMAKDMVNSLVDASEGQSGEDRALLPGERSPEGEADSEGSVRREHKKSFRQKLLEAVAEPEAGPGQDPQE